MEFQRLTPFYEQIRNAVVVVYSLLVMVTVVPSLHNFPAVLLMPYYLLVPGYCATTLSRKNENFIEGLFFSICWSLVVIASVAAINSIGLASLPLDVAIPLITIFILALVHYTTRK